MVKHRIKELRERRKLSQERLGTLIGRDKWFIYRLESGGQKLDLNTARKVAAALECSVEELVGIDSGTSNGAQESRGLAEDVSAYDPKPGDPLAAHVGENHYLLRVDTDVLERSGIRKGDIVRVDSGAEACATPGPLAPVRVRLHRPGEFMEPLSLLRLFVPPRLLITNSVTPNLPSIDMDREDAHVVGVVEGVVYRRLA